jgi:hypothetical protein
MAAKDLSASRTIQGGLFFDSNGRQLTGQQILQVYIEGFLLCREGCACLGRYVRTQSPQHPSGVKQKGFGVGCDLHAGSDIWDDQ